MNKLDKKVTFKIYAEKDSTDTRIKLFIKKYTALSDKLSVTWIDPVLHPAKTYESRSRERYDCNLLQRYRKNEISFF